MIEFAIVGFLVGASLALRFTVLVLVPVMPITLAAVAVGEGLRGGAISWIEMVLVAASVQLGYLSGGILRSVEKSRRENQHSNGATS